MRCGGGSLGFLRSLLSRSAGLSSDGSIRRERAIRRDDESVRRANELYFDFTSTSANGALAFGGGGGGGVDAGEVSGGSVSSTHVTGRSGFGLRCSSSNMRSTRAARSSSELKYSMHKNERDRRGKLLNFGQLNFLAKNGSLNASDCRRSAVRGWSSPTPGAPRWARRER